MRPLPIDLKYDKHLQKTLAYESDRDPTKVICDKKTKQVLWKILLYKNKFETRFKGFYIANFDIINGKTPAVGMRLLF